MADGSRVKADEIDVVIEDYIAHSALLRTDTATNHKKFAVAKKIQHEVVNLNQNQRVQKGYYTYNTLITSIAT